MQTNNNKFLIIGLGSMGKRRIRNLLFLGIDKKNIYGFDSASSRCQQIELEYGIKTFTAIDEAENIHPDAYIISTPPLSHSEYFLRFAKNKKHFFVEATTRNDGYNELHSLLDGSFVAAPSCTFRHFPAVVKIKEILLSGLIGKPLCFNHYLGQYLPDWHPYEDYRHVYFAKKDTGGAREMFPYELIWLTDIFQSHVSRVTGVRGKISDLEMTADDIYGAIIQFDNGILGNVMIDILNRSACRTLKILGSDGTLDWNWLEKKIVLYIASKKTTQVINLADSKLVDQYNTGEEAYEKEMKDFIEAIEGKKPYPYSFAEDDKILVFLDSFTEL